MSLTSKYTVAVGRISDLFEKIRDGQAPNQFNLQLLKDWGFSSSNDRAFLPLLKDLGFLSPDGKPTSRYHEYRDHSRSKAVMAHAIREAYHDLFLIKEHPTDSDKIAIQGKFKSFHNVGDNVASLMMKTFYELLKLSDLKASYSKTNEKSETKENVKKVESVSIHSNNQSDPHNADAPTMKGLANGGLHYNIQIHLPATKDVEVYNAIFKSLKDHLIAS